MPKLFLLCDADGNTYYFRYLDGKTPRIKFNIPDTGSYTGNVDYDIVKICSIEIPSTFPKLPPADRDRIKSTTVIYNPDLQGTPARIYTDSGVIEVGKRFLELIKPVQRFLLWHEKGHLFYSEEENCDMYALVNFLREGYNQSTGYYALSKVLKVSAQNIDRIKANFKNIQKIRKQ
jgi:hypothetical protein